MTPAVKRKFGNKRARVSYIIIHELRKRNWTLTKVAESLGCSLEAVSRTVNGHCHSEQILDALKNIGVPIKFLHDPREAKLSTSTVRKTI